MTQTSSSKSVFKDTFSLIKWELKNRRISLLVYCVLSATFIAAVFAIAMAVGLQANSQDAVRGAAMVFQLVSSYLVFTLTIIFTIIYTAGNYAYLHNKRKIDMYGSLPVDSRTLYTAKTLSAFLFSIVPTMFFFGVIALFSLTAGQPLVNETIRLYVDVLLGTISCIAFYGLLAVCCGTTGHAVVSFISICIAYPLAARMVRDVIRAFYNGIYIDVDNSSFLINALNPISAYSGDNVIYWLLFSTACIFCGILLAKKRRSERAQNSFALFLPAYAVKVIVCFIVGMLSGVLFGSINLLGNGLAGFAFGFLLTSAPACLIIHLIFYRNTKNLFRSSVPYAVMVLVTFAAMGIMNADIFGYNTRVPDPSEVAGAGIVSMEDYCVFGTQKAGRVAEECVEDFTDADDIEKVIGVHRDITSYVKTTSREKLSTIWYYSMSDTLNGLFYGNGQYCVGYRLKNGRTITRVYSGEVTGTGWFATDDGAPDMDTNGFKELRGTSEYIEKYRSLAGLDSDSVTSLEIKTDRSVFSSYISGSDGGKVKTDFETIVSAMKNDKLAIVTDDEDSKNAVCTIEVRYTSAIFKNSQLSSFLSDLTDDDYQTVKVTASDTETRRALRNAGILTADDKLNEDSPYYHAKPENK